MTEHQHTPSNTAPTIADAVALVRGFHAEDGHRRAYIDMVLQGHDSTRWSDRSARVEAMRGPLKVMAAQFEATP